MFKRPAHILFLAAAPGHLARMASDSAARLGERWLEGRGACVDGAGAVGADCTVEPIDLALLEWADLVVTLDELSQRHCPALSPRVRRKHWSLGEVQGCNEARSDLAVDIEARVASMVGGLRMLARSDSTGVQDTGDD